MYVVTVEYMEGEMGDEIHSIIGPFDTQDKAELARIQFIDTMDDKYGDWSQVYTTDVKKVRTFETAENFHTSLMDLYTRTAQDARTIDNEYNLDNSGGW